MFRTGTDYRHAPDSAIPGNDPHGTPWATMGDSDLRWRAGWCMTPDQHEARRRRGQDLAREECKGACDPSKDCDLCYEDLPC